MKIGLRLGRYEFDSREVEVDGGRLVGYLTEEVRRDDNGDAKPRATRACVPEGRLKRRASRKCARSVCL